MAPVAVLILIRPCIEVNTVEGDSLNADRHDGDMRAHLTVEAVLVHAEILRRVTQPDEPRLQCRCGGACSGTCIGHELATIGLLRIAGA